MEPSVYCLSFTRDGENSETVTRCQESYTSQTFTELSPHENMTTLKGPWGFFFFLFLILTSPHFFFPLQLFIFPNGLLYGLKPCFETVSAVLDMNIGKRSHRWTNLSHFAIIDSFKTGLKQNLLLWSSWLSDRSGHILTRPYGLYMGFMGLLTFIPQTRESLWPPCTGLLTSTFFRKQVSAPLSLSGNPWVHYGQWQPNFRSAPNSKY